MVGECSLNEKETHVDNCEGDKQWTGVGRRGTEQEIQSREPQETNERRRQESEEQIETVWDGFSAFCPKPSRKYQELLQGFMNACIKS